MKVIDLGQTGESFSAECIGWDNVGVSSPWLRVIEEFAPKSIPHDIQAIAIRDCQLLGSRRNLVVAGPTNSGKSLLGYLAILSGLTKGRRALLIEPFRALAQEKFDELSAKLPRLPVDLIGQPSVQITTGDYRLDGETLMTEPPHSGEIVIATPERVDAIMRNPDFDLWVSSFGVVCVDEAHLIGDTKRGPSLEGVITRFLCEKAPSRFILLSATIGDCDAVKAWLQPCDVAHSSVRRPPLHQELFVIEKDEKTDDIIAESLKTILSDPAASVLIFVYRTDDADRLSFFLSEKMKPRFVESITAAYHSKMPSAIKATIKADYESHKFRCLVSTTALGAGVNLPATHVIIRDLTFGRDGALPARELIQMMGRAGRGNQIGRATAILKPKDHWEERDLVEQMRNPTLPPLQSALKLVARGQHSQTNCGGDITPQAAKLVMSQLVRREHQTDNEIQTFFNNSFGGKEVTDQVGQAMRWLCDGQRVLAWEGEKGIGATTLGKAITLAGIPLEVGAGFGALIRDVLSCDPEDKLLINWTPLDTLTVLELINPREKGLRRFSKNLAEQVDAWIESNPIKPVLFMEWIRGTSEASRAEEVIGSLGVKLESRRVRGETARRYAYTANLRAIVIYQLGSGLSIRDIQRRWKISGLEGIEERWRDHLLWQLAGILEMFDVRCFYYFLREECKANDTRVNRAKKCLNDMRQGVFKLLGLLRFCSPLGPLFRDLESAKAGVGIRTKEKLESVGVVSFAEIKKMSVEELLGIGIRRDIAQKLKGYVRRRSL